MANCNWQHGACDRIATTALIKNDGEIEQLCEEHYDRVIILMKRIASGENLIDHDDADIAANHWLVKNKIPS